MVAPQDRRLPSADGKAEMPGAGEVMSCMSSVWSLGKVSIRNEDGVEVDLF